MVTVEELNTEEEVNYKKMVDKVKEYCDPAQGNLFRPSKKYRDMFPKQKTNMGQVFPHQRSCPFFESEDVPYDSKDWPIHLDLYLPEAGSSSDSFKDDYIRCWFVYFYRDVLPRIFNSPLYGQLDWIYDRIIETIQCVGGACIFGVHYDFEIHFETPMEFAKRSKIVLDVIKDWAPMELKRFIMAKIPRVSKFNKNPFNLYHVLPLVMFEFAVVSLNSAISQLDEREVVDRLLDYIFKGKFFLNLAEMSILQSFFTVIEVSKIAAEQTIKRLLAGKKDLDTNDKLIVFCFNNCRFNYELFTNSIVALLKPDVALADAKSRRKAKRAMLIMSRILKLNSEVMKCDVRENLCVQPGKYLLELVKDKVLRQEAEKLSQKIAETYPSVVPKINDKDYEVLSRTYVYEW